MRIATLKAVGLWMLLFAPTAQVLAGMPSALPTNWTIGNPPQWGPSSGSAFYGANDARWQAISFFLACLLLSAAGVRWLWNTLRGDIPALPPLSYKRSLSFVVLWGLAFVIVLTMISGARELMTPGAWRKQGWTYKLNDSSTAAQTNSDQRTERRQALERLRDALWRYAAMHQGKFPAAGSDVATAPLWDIPGWPGLQFLSIPDRQAEESGRLLVFEPELDGDERQVLLTNGVLGTMRSAEIKQIVSSGATP